MRRWLVYLFITFIVVILPFALLVRGAVALYSRLGWPPWLAIAGGVLLAAAFVAAIAGLALRRLERRPRWRTLFLWLALPATVGFAGQGLLVLAAPHAKTSAERADWRRTHPLLRLATATLLVIDRDLLITDLSRTADDYAAMGLPLFERSQHFPQTDGRVHAMDLRTIGRSRVRNWVVETFYRAMGFRTLRHLGTADHLHVGMP